MALYGGGEPVKAVAYQLGISEETAKSYLKRIREKYRVAGFDVGTKVALRKRAIQDGILLQDAPTAARSRRLPSGVTGSRPGVASRIAVARDRCGRAGARERERDAGHAEQRGRPRSAPGSRGRRR